MKKAWNFVKSLYFWYIVRWWWTVKPPKDTPYSGHYHDQGQTLDDD